MPTVSTSIDNVAKDGMKVANKAANLIIAFGGITAGVGLAATDVKTEFVKGILESIGIKSEVLARGITIIVLLILLTIFISLMAAFKSPITKAIMLFFITAFGTYMLILGIRTIVQLATGKIKLKA